MYTQSLDVPVAPSSGTGWTWRSGQPADAQTLATFQSADQWNHYYRHSAVCLH
jgi:hypothetical protein